MSNTTSTVQAPATQSTKTQVILGSFGDGRYSPAMSELYRDSQRLLGFTKEQAHVTSVRLGVDAGQLGASKVTLSYGKSTDKDGRRTLKEITKGVKMNTSWALDIASVCAQLDDARKSGLIVKQCTMNTETMDSVDKAVTRIEAVEA